jgi:CubicO group peptidase (beta-lactamase class C family)
MRDRRTFVALFVALAVVAACSDDPSDDQGAATSEEVTASSASAVDTTAGPDSTVVGPEATAAPADTSAPRSAPAPAASSSAPATTAPLASAYPGQPAGVPFPTLDWAVGPLPAGVDPAVIDAAVDVAFGAPDADARVRSIVVVEGGQIVYERYHPLDGPDVVYDSYSVAKSFTSALVGMLVADGTLALDEHPPRPEWATPGDPRQAITLRQLLQMSSGL